MSEDEGKLIVQRIAEERRQGSSTRKELYSELEQELGLPVVSFFTSFRYPVMIEDSDADMLEGILQKCCLDNGFALLISSPGGSGLTAERIINICRSYSGNHNYIAIVPGKAKSAATMVCFGASKIIMGHSSELGAIDPQQLIVEEDKQTKWFSVYNIVSSYRRLFKQAVEVKGNLQPYLQQLANYDEREIAEMESVLEFSEDFAIKTLKSGMLARYSYKKIREKIGIFLTPREMKVHGRPIYAAEARRHGLKVEVADVRSRMWMLVYELYVRLNDFVSNDNIGKCIECKDYSFRATMAK
jgi:hypothetical protein